MNLVNQYLFKLCQIEKNINWVTGNMITKIESKPSYLSPKWYGLHEMEPEQIYQFQETSSMFFPQSHDSHKQCTSLLPQASIHQFPSSPTQRVKERQFLQSAPASLELSMLPCSHFSIYHSPLTVIINPSVWFYEKDSLNMMETFKLPGVQQVEDSLLQPQSQSTFPEIASQYRPFLTC